MNKRLARKVFLEAAQIQFKSLESGERVAIGSSHYACDNIGYALALLGMIPKWNGTVYHDYFTKHFEPTGEERQRYPAFSFVGWWPLWQQEERILALLLCAEMLKE